jgi:hypothetical protein
MPVYGQHQTSVGPRWRPYHFAVTAPDLALAVRTQSVPRVRTACGRLLYRGRYTRDPVLTSCQPCRRALARREPDIKDTSV